MRFLPTKAKELMKATRDSRTYSQVRRESVGWHGYRSGGDVRWYRDGDFDRGRGAGHGRHGWHRARHDQRVGLDVRW